MKKTALAAKVLFAAIAISLASCAGQTEKKSDNAAPEATEQEKAQAESLNIRYIDLDSIMAGYTLAQEISQKSQKMLLDYQRLERQKQNEIQNLGNQIEQKRSTNGYLTQESFDADVNTFNKKQNEAANLLQGRQNQINNEIASQQQRLTDSIMNYVKVYNAEKGYDAILLRDAGIYFNPALNITAEILEGLNARYVPAAK